MKYFSLLLVYLNLVSLSFSNHIKGLDDSILFQLNWPGQSDGLLEYTDYEKFEMITNNNEKFQCLVPMNYGEATDESDIYSGENALQLLMPLFKKNVITIRIESYWTYEMSHGQHIIQYHEERGGQNVRLQEYTLGISSMQKFNELQSLLEDELSYNPNPEIPQIKIEGINMPYFAVKYTDGTMCDLTNAPRTTRVLYVCFENSRHPALYSIKEILTCEYEMVILTSLLCQHPSYRLQEITQTDLHCIPINNEQKRPTNLIQLEAESLKFRTPGAVTEHVSEGSVRLEVVDDNDNIGQIFVMENLKENSRDIPFPVRPSIDLKLIEDFFNGDHCLQGGSGWWKYEFCHGKLVTQFHESDTGQIVIRLGYFDLKKHTAWIEKHPKKKFQRGKMSVSHFYSGGDICESIQKPREVEVKLICKEAASASSVTLYLLEPSTCEYILGVETSIVCPLLQNADELGLFTLDQLHMEETIENLILKHQDGSVVESVIKIIQEIVIVDEVPDRSEESISDNGVKNDAPTKLDDPDEDSDNN